MSDTDKKEETDSDIEVLPENDESENDEPKEVEEEDASSGDKNTTSALLKKLEIYQEQALSSKDDALRHRAELENFRKRMQREKDELRKVAAGMVIEELLPVLDNLKLGLQSAEQHPEAKVVVEGFQMVAAQLQSVLVAHGLKELAPIGDRFDPNFHECLSHEESDDVPEDHVLKVVRSGYTLNERLLRPANVIVSSGAEKDEEDPPASESEEPGI